MEPRPELIVVEGHQAGLRAVLLDNTVLLGRSRQCQVQLMEPYISRRQAEFRVTSDGWLIENIAPEPILINGKKYRQTHKVYLETGDVVTVGQQTKLLFISAEDEPEAALTAYRTAHPTPEELIPLALPPLLADKYQEPELVGSESHDVALFSSSGPGGEELPPVSPLAGGGTMSGAVAIDDDLVPVEGTDAGPVGGSVVPAPAGGAAAGGAPVMGSARAGLADPADVQEPDAESDPLLVQAEEKHKKYVRYAVFGGVYLVLIVGLIVFLTILRNRAPVEEKSISFLSTDAIAELIDESIESKGDNSVTVSEYTVLARQYYTKRNSSRGNLYRCVKYYKLAKAWGGVPSSDDEIKFDDAKNQLAQKMSDGYSAAHTLLLDRDYEGAVERYEALLQMYPTKEEPGANREDEFVENIEHYLGLAIRRQRP
jgi:hypothetical protein